METLLIAERSMPIIRAANDSDWDDIMSLLQSMELDHASIAAKNFWIVEVDREIIAVAQLESSGDHLFLSSVGVRPDQRGKGLATALLKEMLSLADQDVYLYTVIPVFFKKFGFVTAPSPEGDGYRKHFDCLSCDPKSCVCMRRSPGG